MKIFLFILIQIIQYFNFKPARNLLIPRIHSLHNGPMAKSYSKWDKYDPDVELMKLDNNDKTNTLQANIKKNMNLNKNLLVGLNETSIHDRVKSLISMFK